jgi:hypothetical protein
MGQGAKLNLREYNVPAQNTVPFFLGSLHMNRTLRLKQHRHSAILEGNRQFSTCTLPKKIISFNQPPLGYGVTYDIDSVNPLLSRPQLLRQFLQIICGLDLNNLPYLGRIPHQFLR